MDINDYQSEADRTLITDPGFEIGGYDEMKIWMALGLAGEAGEVCDLIKKGIYHRHGLDRDRLKEELGDVMWYVASLCTLLGLNMSDVCAENVAKLESRYPNGYSPEASKNRTKE